MASSSASPHGGRKRPTLPAFRPLIPGVLAPPTNNLADDQIALLEHSLEMMTEAHDLQKDRAENLLSAICRRHCETAIILEMVRQAVRALQQGEGSPEAVGAALSLLAAAQGHLAVQAEAERAFGDGDLLGPTVLEKELPLQKLDTPAQRRLLRALEEAVEAAEEVDTERGDCADGRAFELSLLLDTVREEVHGPAGQGEGAPLEDRP